MLLNTTFISKRRRNIIDQICKGFGPTITKPIDVKILILGTCPGVKSLKNKKSSGKAQYYENKGNRFWGTIFSILEKKYNCSDPKDYSGRINILSSYGICLWDLYSTCIRYGSSDKEIKDAVPNDFSKYSGVYIFVNSKQAVGNLKKHCRNDQCYKKIIEELSNNCVVSLQSTSGGNRYFKNGKDWEDELLKVLP